MNERPLVRQTGDRQQVEKAEKQTKFNREQELADLVALLDEPAGRRMLWRMLTHCKTFESIWDPSSKVHYNSGKQDVGHFLLAEIMAAKPAAFTQMMTEHNAKAKEPQADA